MSGEDRIVGDMVAIQDRLERASSLPSVHPIADVFPMMSDEEFDGLKNDIRAHGLRESITLWKGQVVDGRNRLRACCEVGVEPQFCELDDATDPIAWALSFNLHRRHLTPSQRAMVAARCRKIYDDEASGRKKATEGRPAKDKPVENLPPVSKAKARDKAGEALKVSGKTVDAATKVLKSDRQEIIAAVDSGSLSVHKAAQIVADKPVTKARPKIDEKVGRPVVKHEASDAMEFAQMAILQLERIKPDDPRWRDAFTKVEDWIASKGMVWGMDQFFDKRPEAEQPTATQLKNKEFLSGCRGRLSKSLRSVVLQFGHLGLGGQADTEVKSLRRKAGL